jgi:cysteinyl-tRNA synthetase
MALLLYNTLTRKKEIFTPLHDHEVSIYSCGPTVYHFAHIGNFRAYVVADLLKRYLTFKGFKVKHIMNITDVDDKTIKNSQAEHISLQKYTEKYTEAFFDDLDTLNIQRAELYPKATLHIKEMVAIIKTLMDKGFAYKSEDGSIYYDISKFPSYGKFSHIEVANLKAGARVKQDEYEKETANDFAVWKGYDKADGDVFWDTEIGKGRPGWHIECSAMSMKYLGKHFDIHTGGVDLIFPHHQNEIAQSEAATGEKFVNCWVHNEHLLVDGKKMSKSLGNFYTLRDLLNKKYEAKAIRYLLMSTHYRQQLNFTLQGVDAAKNAVERLNNFIFTLQNATGSSDNPKITELIENAKKSFLEKMDDDLNISEALGVIFDFIRDVNKEKYSTNDAMLVKKTMFEFNKVLGVLEEQKTDISSDIKRLIDEREEARKNKDFKKADSIRDALKNSGIIIEDTASGVVWKKAA